MQNYDDLVSIIMPAYNAELTIKSSIDSVINQKYEHWELLIVDDGSSDNTTDIVKKYTLINCNIKLLKNVNQSGAAGARKTAIDFSNGRYLSFLDSDDIWSTDKLEKQISFMKNNHVGFVYSDYCTFNKSPTEIKKTIITPSKLSYYNVIKHCMIGCLTVTIDKKFFSDIDYPISPKEDFAFWLKLLRQIEFAYRVPDCLSYYRLSSNSLSSNKIKEIKKQWYVIRKVEKTNILLSTYYLFIYAYKGFLKHFL